ncbi:MAG: pyridoxamine 5'-phosphate oxidase [Nocardioidaceae bacterium]
MNAHDELSQLRHEYAAGGLSESDLEPDPVVMFRRWMADIVASGLHEPNAMVVATVDAQGCPSARMVLLKAVDEGFVFFTNYRSRKAGELDGQGACALLFPWHDLERQVRVEGRAERLTAAENADYFASRPRGSQVGAWASPQSEVVGSREELDATYAAEEARFGADGEIPVPPYWGGFRVVPEVVEFWQGRPGRMHDRLRYRRDGGAWVVERLAP